jgi:hypothetical protein
MVRVLGCPPCWALPGALFLSHSAILSKTREDSHASKAGVCPRKRERERERQRQRDRQTETEREREERESTGCTIWLVLQGCLAGPSEPSQDAWGLSHSPRKGADILVPTHLLGVRDLD